MCNSKKNDVEPLLEKSGPQINDKIPRVDNKIMKWRSEQFQDLKPRATAADFNFSSYFFFFLVPFCKLEELRSVP